MTTAVDTNVVIALWDRDSALSLAALTALDPAFNRGAQVAAAPVFAELTAAPGRSEAFVTSFFEETESAFIGSCQSRYGGWQEELFKPMQNVGANRELRERAAVSRTLLSGLTQCRMVVAFSP